jgi:hypothetical protein
MKNSARHLIAYICCASTLCSSAFAAPLGLPQSLTDRNMKIVFEVLSPWNILSGSGEAVSGLLKADSKNPRGLLAEISVQKIVYRAGLSIAGRMVEAWLNVNPPTPAKFIIGKSSLKCPKEAISLGHGCTGTVDGKLSIWAKTYDIDIPVEIVPASTGFQLKGAKRINWGDYGFGDPSSTIAHIRPVIALDFSIDLPPG